MIPVSSRHPPGTIVVPCGDLGRYTEFTATFCVAKVPNGSQTYFAKGAGIAENRNRALCQLNGEWAWLMDDDHRVPPEMLLRLLDHDKDVIVPFTTLRKPPFRPVLFKEELYKGAFKRWRLNDLPLGGLLKVAGAGTAGMLVRKRVIDALANPAMFPCSMCRSGRPCLSCGGSGVAPWFEVGQVSTDALGEDLWFCSKVLAAGFDIWADLDLPLDHLTTCSVRPSLVDGHWGIETDYDNGFCTWMPSDERTA